MTELLRFREKFGLSQSNIATYLGVSVSTVKMVETGKRILTSSAAARCAHLLQYSYNEHYTLQNNTAETDNEELLMVKGDLNRYIKRATSLVKKQQRLLITMQVRYQQALQRQNLLTQIRNDLPTLEVDIIWLDLLTAVTFRELWQNGVKAQTIVQWRIDTYNYGIRKALALEQEYAVV